MLSSSLVRQRIRHLAMAGHSDVFHFVTFLGFFLLSVVTCNSTSKDLQLNSAREGKLFSLVQIIQFQNGPCVSSTGRAGTCFTQGECQNKQGIGSGTCAEGFGICCVFTLGCGQTSNQNCVYLTNRPGSNIPNPCAYTICPCDDSICRIRLDFESFVINGPQSGTTEGRNVGVAGSGFGGAIGDCLSDSMILTSPGGMASPVICGFNTGQHMIMDASAACHMVLFNTRGASNTRSWDIKVTQFKCKDDSAGPPGCLQYFTGMSGRIASFNYPTTDTTVVDPSATHLSNQCYSICFRQEPGQCALCFAPVVAGGESKIADNLVPGSFGLSNPVKVKPRGENDIECVSDYLRIPGAEAKGLDQLGNQLPFAVGQTTVGSAMFTKICGRYFSAINNGNLRFQNERSVCTQNRPFRIDFKTDADEMTEVATNTNAKRNEQSGFPGGITGFFLEWEMVPC